RRLRVAVAIAVGASLPIAALAGYDWIAFGGPLETGYAHVEGFAGMKRGVMGVTYPRLPALWGILGGSYRGLCFHAPVTLAGLIGFAALLARPPRRAG